MTVIEKLIRTSVWAVEHKGEFSLAMGGILVLILIVRVIRGSAWHRPAIAFCVIPIGLQAGYSLMCAVVAYLIGHLGLALMFGALGGGQLMIAWMFVRLAKAL